MLALIPKRPDWLCYPQGLGLIYHTLHHILIFFKLLNIVLLLDRGFCGIENVAFGVRDRSGALLIRE